MPTNVIEDPFLLSMLHDAIRQAAGKAIAILVSDRGFYRLWQRMASDQHKPVTTKIETDGYEVSIKRLGTLVFEGLPVLQVEMKADCIVVIEE